MANHDDHHEHDEDDQQRNPGQQHADKTLGPSEHRDRDHHEQGEDASERYKDQSDIGAEREAQQETKSDAQSTLADREEKAGKEDGGDDNSGAPAPDSPPYDTRTPAEREASPAPIPYSGEESAPKKKGKSRALMTILAMVGIIGGGVSLYSALTSLPRDLIEQEARVVRQRASGYMSQRVQNYFWSFLAKTTFGNTIAINDCANDLTPAPMVTKDCFYRHRQEYPKTTLGRIWQAWWDGKVAKRMVEAGIDIEYKPGGPGSPPKWVITARGKDFEVGIDDPEGDVQRFEREAKTRGDIQDIYKEFSGKFRDATKVSAVERILQRVYWKRQFGLRGCMFYCLGKNRPPAGMGKLTTFISRFKSDLAVKVFGSHRLGLAWACMLSREYNCSDSDSEFRKKYAENIKSASKTIDGAAKIEEALKIADRAKNSGRGLIDILIKSIVTKIAGRTVANIVSGPIPVISEALAIINIAGLVVMGYYIYDALSGPIGQMFRTKTLDEAYAGAASVASVVADEPNAVSDIYDPNASAAVAAIYEGYEESAVYQSQFGNIQGLKNYNALFGREAHAETTDPEKYPNKCADNLKRPEGKLVCPNWQYDYKPPILAAAQQYAIPSGVAHEALDNISGVINDVVDVANAPSDAATQAALDTDVGRAVLEGINGKIGPLIGDVTRQVLVPPFDSVDDIHGAKLLDASWAGIDRSTNLQIKGGLRDDGTPYGWGRVLTEDEVNQQSLQAYQEINEEFASLPLWDRIFSTKYTQSFATQFAFAAPSAGKSPFQFIASIFNPMTGMRYAFLNTPEAHAAITPATNFFHIPQYGAGTADLDKPMAISLDQVDPCSNDRTPLSLDAPGAINRGLGEAEFSTANMCLADQQALLEYSAWDSGEPLDPDTADSSATSGGAHPSTNPTGILAWPIYEADYKNDLACFGETRTTSDGGTYKHTGIDLVGAGGQGQTQILAADGGLVVSLSRDATLSTGQFVVIKHGETQFTSYMYLDTIDPKLAVDSPVYKGQVLGTMGSSGETEGPHLHFEVGSTPYSDIATRINPLIKLPLSGTYRANTHCPTI